MNSRDLVEHSIRGCGLDCVPIIPLVGVHSAYLFNKNSVEAFNNSGLMARLQIDMAKYYGVDGVFSYMNLSVEAEATGLDIVFHEDYPFVNSFFNDFKEFLERDLNINVFKRYVNAVDKIYSEIGEKLFISSYVTGPFTIGYQIFGGRRFLKWIFTKKYFIKDVLEKIYEKFEIYLDMFLKSRVDLIMVLEPTLIYLSPKKFEKLCIDVLSKIFRKIGMANKYSALHICGDNSHLLKSIDMLEVNVVQIDSPVDLKFARNIVEDKCLLGNIDTNLLKNGSRRDIVDMVEKCLENCGDTLFILSTGCEVVKDTPPQNILYMVEAGRGLV